MHPHPDAGTHVVALPDAAVVVSACGTCPSGSHCGSANGTPVCRNNQSNIPAFQHVFVIVMENLSYPTLTSAANAQYSPYLHGLMTSAAYSTDYHGVAHPSLANYIALTSGDTQGIGCDCNPTGTGVCSRSTCNTFIHTCACARTANNIGDQLEAAHLKWRAYGEDMGAPCSTLDSGNYAVRHVPFLYYTGIQTVVDRCSEHVVDLDNLNTDLSPGHQPAFVFIAPNLVHDMHDPVIPGGGTNIQNGDTWLAQVVPQITASDAYQHGGLLVIVWDEDDYSGVISADDPIPLFLLSRYARTSYPSATHADHYSLLATFEDGLGLPRLGNAATATPLSDFFPAQ